MANLRPLISVVMSVYNGENYLKEAIESILIQTYRKFEFIIINDGSTDNSLKIIQEYMKKDKRIILINRENRGLIYSLNEGIALSKGKYIARMDADDIALPYRFEKQLQFMEANLDVGVCGSWVEIFGEKYSNKVWKLPEDNHALQCRLLFSVPVAHPSIFLRKRLWDNYSMQYDIQYKHAEDYKLWVDLSKYTKFSNLQEVLLRYRYLDNSISREADKLKDDSRYRTLKSIFGILLDKLRIQNTEKENQIHFMLMKNERIKETTTSLTDVSKYFLKLLNHNRMACFYDIDAFNSFLGKKYLSFLFLTKQGNILKYNYYLIYLGIIGYIK